MEKATLIKITNPFNRLDREVSKIELTGETLFHLRELYFPKDVEVAVSLNGKLVKDIDLQRIKPKDSDFITFIPITTGGDDGGKDIIRAVAFIGVALASWGVGAALATTVWGGMATGYAAAVSAWGIASVIGSIATMLVGGLLINALLPPSAPELGSMDVSGIDKSQTYSWSGKTTQQQGTVIPKTYGTIKNSGNILEAYTESTGSDTAEEQQYLSVLICLGMGPISRLYSYEINDQPIENLDGIDIYARYGELTQTIIPNFTETIVENTVALKATYSSPIIYTTPGSDFDDLEIEVNFPNGLYYLDDTGGLSSLDVTFQIDARKNGTETWTAISQQVVALTTITDTSYWSAGEWYDAGGSNQYTSDVDFTYIPNWQWLEVASGGTVTTAHYDGEDYYDTSRFFPYKWRWINQEWTHLVDSTLDYYKITGSKNSAIKKSFFLNSIPDSDKGRYDIRLTRITPDRTGSRYMDYIYLNKVKEKIRDGFTYPRQALVGMKALATNQLSGGFDFSCMVDGALIRSYDGAAYTVTFSNNPAWVCYDILTQPVIDNQHNIVRWDGISPTRIDVDSFKEWADWCDELVPDGYSGTEKRMTFNGTFDTDMNMWDAAWKACQVGRAALVWRGTVLYAVVDKEETPVQLFTVGNIADGTFKETFLSLEDRASEIEVDFINSEKDYERDKFTVINTNLDNPSNKVNLQLIGITKPSEAWRAADYRLLCNQYQLRTIEFQADIDSIACTVGDVVRISHEIPQWGYGGRVISANATSVTIDRPVTLAIGTTYEITIKLSDDTVVTKEVLTASDDAEHTVLDVSTFASIPEQYDVYAFGEVSVSYKDFRIIDITRTQDQKCSITAVEYSSNVYANDSGTPVMPQTTNYSALDPYAIVSNATATELSSFDISGAVKRDIKVTFTISDSALYKYASIYYRKSSESLWTYAGDTYTNEAIIKNVSENTTYQVYIVPVNTGGIKTPTHRCATCSVTTTFTPNFQNTALGNRVSGLQIFNQATDIEWEGKDCKFVWNDITVVDEESGAEDANDGAAGSSDTGLWFRAYEVRILDTAGVLRRTEYVQLPEFVYTYEKNCEDGSGIPVGDFTIEVKAVDNFGNKSSLAAILSVENLDPTPITGITTDFTGRDLIISWSANTETDLDYYELTLNSTVKYIKRTGFTYTIDDNISDNGSADPSISYSLRAVDVFRNKSTTVSGTATNTAPSAPSNVTATAGVKVVTIKFDALTDTDIDGYEVYVSTSPGFTPDATTLKGKGLQTLYTFDGETDTTYYIKVRAYDPFQYSDYTSEVSCTPITVASTDIADFAITASKIFTNIPILANDAWTDNDPSSGYISWNEHNLYYSGANYTITAANTNSKYIWWENGAGSYSSSDTNPTLDDGDFIIATNISGYHDLAWNAIANQVIGSAYIQDLAVITAKINNLAVTTGKIDDLAVTNAKIDNLAVTGAKIASAQIDNAHLVTATITSAKINDVAADKITAGTINTGDINVESTLNIGSLGQVFIDGNNEVIKIFGETVVITESAPRNDVLDWIEDATTYSVTIISGEYTPDALANVTCQAMRTKGSANTTITYSSTTRKATIANSSLSTLSLLWSSGTNTNFTCGKALGFDIGEDDTGALTYTGDDEIALRVELGKIE